MRLDVWMMVYPSRPSERHDRITEASQAGRLAKNRAKAAMTMAISARSCAWWKD